MKNINFKPLDSVRSHEELRSTVEYIVDFLQLPHPSRPGPVCPAIGKLIAQKTLYLGDVNDTYKSQIQDSIENAINFQKLSLSETGSTIIVFNENSVWRKINDLHIKNLLLAMESGFLLGVFGPESMVTSVHHTNFFPNRSPKNMLVS